MYNSLHLKIGLLQNFGLPFLQNFCIPLNFCLQLYFRIHLKIHILQLNLRLQLNFSYSRLCKTCRQKFSISRKYWPQGGRARRKGKMWIPLSTVNSRVLTPLVKKHMQAFSDCLWRGFLVLMYCDLLTKSWFPN